MCCCPRNRHYKSLRKMCTKNSHRLVKPQQITQCIITPMFSYMLLEFDNSKNVQLTSRSIIIKDMEEEHKLKKHAGCMNRKKVRQSIIYMYCLDRTCPTNHHHNGLIATGRHAYPVICCYYLRIQTVLKLTLEQLTY